ncbi:hypothetical protein N0V93_002197 [Gnomoniopsis smithogilvyi]|uniref:Uncharacterized protein n=1 Tax=Gnomoniopsis smithogilvyi TaxID=1191159 RepID=A0A9W8YW69_9PEZI|nr:hypothetical protein N0V93_002197 [Gnomoniopsis smithogilvyi]
MAKRVRIQSAHGILIPGGLPNSPRRAMWRSKQHTLLYLSAALVLYGLFCTTRNLLHDAAAGIILPPADRYASSTASSPYDYYEGGAGAAAVGPVSTDDDCPEYGRYAAMRHEPFTGGSWNLPYQRPVKGCRKVVVDEVEEVIREMNKTVKDPDLFRLFENCFPNTLDTSVMWTGVSSENVKEELTFITTGDIHAMWLRDSANQLQSYVSLLHPPPQQPPTTSPPAPSKLASLFRGAINLQTRYLLASPHCNAFQPPVEAEMAPGNDGNPHDLVFPAYDPAVVFECKYELDSLAAFLQLSWDYYSRTKDARFFVDASKRKKGGGRHAGWKAAVVAILDTAEAMRQGTYTSSGMVHDSPYRFERISSVPTESLGNRGNGSPVREGTGMVRSSFRPSDDSTTFQLLVPANMMLAKYLELCAEIVAGVEKEEAKAASVSSGVIGKEKAAQGVLKDEEKDEDEAGNGETVTERMKRMAKEIRKGIDKYGKVKHPDFGEIFAYETDGYTSTSMMDDANLPSLLSAPLTGYLPRTDPTYRATRKFILSPANPYYGHGPVLNGTGGPHIGPGMVWPMSLIVGIMTTDDDEEIKDLLRQVLASTDFLGLIHESVNVHNAALWTRSWFSWANGLFGQMMLDLRARKPHILKISFQGENGAGKKG